jgi:CHAD domain-containing protein
MENGHAAPNLCRCTRQRPALEFAAEQLAKRTKKISKKIEDIETLDAQRRHKLHISVKKLRYACEFFARLFDSRKQTTQRKHFVKTLKNLQGSLGNLNDIEVHKRMATRIAHPRKRSRKQTEEALAMGFIAGQEDQQIATCVAMAGRQASNCPICQNSGIRRLSVWA